MYRKKYFIVTERGKIYLKDTFLKWLSNSEAVHLQKKATVNLQKEVPLGLLNCVRKSEGFYYSISKCKMKQKEWELAIYLLLKNVFGHNKNTYKKYWGIFHKDVTPCESDPYNLLIKIKLLHPNFWTKRGK